jgi:hypothetical protein
VESNTHLIKYNKPEADNRKRKYRAPIAPGKALKAKAN